MFTCIICSCIDNSHHQGSESRGCPWDQSPALSSSSAHQTSQNLVQASPCTIPSSSAPSKASLPQPPSSHRHQIPHHSREKGGHSLTPSPTPPSPGSRVGSQHGRRRRRVDSYPRRDKESTATATANSSCCFSCCSTHSLSLSNTLPRRCGEYTSGST